MFSSSIISMTRSGYRKIDNFQHGSSVNYVRSNKALKMAGIRCISAFFMRESLLNL